MSDMSIQAHSNLQQLTTPAGVSNPTSIATRTETTTVEGNTSTTKITDPGRDAALEVIRSREQARERRDTEIKDALQLIGHGITGSQDGKAANSIMDAVIANFKQVGGIDGSEKIAFKLLEENLGKNRTFITQEQADRFIATFKAAWGNGMFGAEGDRKKHHHTKEGMNNPDVIMLQGMLNGLNSEITNSPEYTKKAGDIKAAQLLVDYDKQQQARDSNSDGMILELLRSAQSFAPKQQQPVFKPASTAPDDIFGVDNEGKLSAEDSNPFAPDENSRASESAKEARITIDIDPSRMKGKTRIVINNRAYA